MAATTPEPKNANASGLRRSQQQTTIQTAIPRAKAKVTQTDAPKPVAKQSPARTI